MPVTDLCHPDHKGLSQLVQLVTQASICRLFEICMIMAERLSRRDLAKEQEMASASAGLGVETPQTMQAQQKMKMQVVKNIEESK